jgi:hypothetical protein
MAYIGKTPVIGNFQKCDSIAVVNGQAAYTLQVGGTNVSPQSENHMLVSLNGILQAPVDSFTVSGSTLTFASNLVTGDVIDFVMILGNVLDLGVPSDNTVSLAKLTATGTKDATTFLRGDNTFGVPPLGGITEADQWRLIAAKNSDGDIDANLERNDTDSAYIGTGMTESSGIFTFPSTGLYWIVVNARLINYVDDNQFNLNILVTTDNSTYTQRAVLSTGDNESGETRTSVAQNIFFNVTNTTTHKVKFNLNSLSSGLLSGGTDQNETSFTFIRLGDST